MNCKTLWWLQVLKQLMIALIWIAHTLVRRLSSVVNLLSDVSEGDLTSRLSLGNNPRDEFNQLGRAANQMIEDVGGLLGESVRSTEVLLEVRAQLAQTTERLNRSSRSVELQTLVRSLSARAKCSLDTRSDFRRAIVGSGLEAAKLAGLNKNDHD